MPRPDHSNVYKGPGLWEGCFILPAVAVVAVLSAVTLSVLDARTIALRAAVAGVAAGAVSWIVFWDAFARLHPRFSEGSGASVKWVMIVAGPPVVALLAAVLLR